MPRTMKAAGYIDQVELVNERFSLLDKESEKLSEHEIIRKIITPNIPKEWERDYLLKEGDKTKTLKAAKTILKTIEKAHRNIAKVEEEPSGNKKPKEHPTPNTTDTNKCRLIRHSHIWKNCPNNPASKNYNRTHYHYSKIQEQEHAGTNAPDKTNDTSTNSDDESKRPLKKKRHRDRERREAHSLDSIDSNASCDSNFVSIHSDTSCDAPLVKWDQVRDSIGVKHSSDWENESQYSYSAASEHTNAF